MLQLIKLWIVTYTLENGKKNKCRFYTYENKNTKDKTYIIKNDLMEFEREVSVIEGNSYFLDLLKYDKNAVVNKVV